MFWNETVSPDKAPYDVLIKRGEFTDPARDGRIVPYKLYHPAPGQVEGRMPVIIWSHGLGGSRDGASFLARYIAGYGYIVVNIQHEGTDTSLWEGKPGHPWDNIRAAHIPRKKTLQRFCDVPFVLDELTALAEQYPLVAREMDMESIGMSGHSFGAITTQVMAGQHLGKGKRKYRLHEPRFKAAIAYSPSPTYNHAVEPPEDIYSGMEIPMMFMTGTEDASPISGKSYHYRLPIFENAKGDENHLLVLEGGDHMVFAGSRGKLNKNPKREKHEDIIRVASLAFWDAYLKDDKAAHDWLADGGFSDWLNGEGEYQFRTA